MMFKLLILSTVMMMTLSVASGQGTTCEGHPINKSLAEVDDLFYVQGQFIGCRHVTGSVIINFDPVFNDEQNGLINYDFGFLSQLESIGGVLSFENVNLIEQIVIPNLRHIEGNELIPGITASLRISNVSGGDMIFPNLIRINRGDAYFNITNDMCGYRGIDWTVILVNGSLVNKSSIDCNMPSCDNCASGHCWSEGSEYCQLLPAADCPIAGQERLECASAYNTTCSNYLMPITCPAVCVVNDCQCPAGSVINEQTNSCVVMENFPKDGLTCPNVTGPGLCVQECNNNNDCERDLLCCSNGCGSVCSESVDKCAAIQCPSIPICPDGSAPITDDPFRCCPYCAPRDDGGVAVVATGYTLLVAVCVLINSFAI